MIVQGNQADKKAEEAQAHEAQGCGRTAAYGERERLFWISYSISALKMNHSFCTALDFWINFSRSEKKTSFLFIHLIEIFVTLNKILHLGIKNECIHFVLLSIFSNFAADL